MKFSASPGVNPLGKLSFIFTPPVCFVNLKTELFSVLYGIKPFSRKVPTSSGRGPCLEETDPGGGGGVTAAREAKPAAGGPEVRGASRRD